MKVQGTSLSKLFATKIDQKASERTQEARNADSGNSVQAVETSLRGSVTQNLEAARAIARVAQALPTSESGPGRTSKSGVATDTEVERANQSSSETRTEDVDMFAEKLARSILTNPGKALDAQNNLANEKVESLLR